MPESYISTHFVDIPPLEIFPFKLYSKTYLLRICVMEKSINILGISGNRYIASFAEWFLIVTCTCDLCTTHSKLSAVKSGIHEEC